MSNELSSRSAEIVTLTGAVAEHRAVSGGYEDTIKRLQQELRHMQDKEESFRQSESKLKSSTEVMKETVDKLQSENSALEQRVREKVT